MNDRRTSRGKVLVTGAAGHLGANLVRRLLADSRDVRVLLRPDSDNAAVDGLPVERVLGDLRDEDAVRQAVRGAETIYHCAANVSTLQGRAAHKREIYASNVLGTRNLLRAAHEAGALRVVVTGSFSAVGYDPDDPSKPSDEAMPFCPFLRHLPYGHTKALVEHECLKAVAEGLDVVVCTSTAILGPHDYKPSRMGRLLLDHVHRRLHAYIPGGFEFVSARDICEAHVLSMERGRAGQKYIIATQFMSVDDLFDIYEEVTGVPRPRLRLPAGVMQALAHVSDFVTRAIAPGHETRFTPDAVRILRMSRHADTTKARRELGFEPTTIRDAIAAAHEDFVRRGCIPGSIARPAAPRRAPSSVGTAAGVDA